MPTFAGFALDALSGDRGIKLDHRFAAFDWRIGTAADYGASFQQAVPGISLGKTVHPEPRWCEKQIADGVRWLHGSNNSELPESRHILWIQDLGVLNAPTRLANFPVLG